MNRENLGESDRLKNFGGPPGSFLENFSWIRSFPLAFWGESLEKHPSFHVTPSSEESQTHFFSGNQTWQF